MKKFFSTGGSVQLSRLIIGGRYALQAGLVENHGGAGGLKYIYCNDNPYRNLSLSQQVSKIRSEQGKQLRQRPSVFL